MNPTFILAITKLAVESEENQNNLRELGVFEILKEFLVADVIARRPVHHPTYDHLCEAFLLLIARLGRRTMDKTTTNLSNIEKVFVADSLQQQTTMSDEGDNDTRRTEHILLLHLVQLMAEHMNSANVAANGCWMFAVLSSDSTERQTLLDAYGATMITAFALHRSHIIHSYIRLDSTYQSQTFASFSYLLHFIFIRHSYFLPSRSLCWHDYRHKEDPKAAAMACRAVRNLSCVDEIAAKLVQV